MKMFCFGRSVVVVQLRCYAQLPTPSGPELLGLPASICWLVSPLERVAEAPPFLRVAEIRLLHYVWYDDYKAEIFPRCRVV